MAAVTVYTTRMCPYCMHAKQLLDSKGAVYEEIAVDVEPERRLEMMQRSGRRTVPQIWLGEQHIGGCDDLYRLEQAGRLDEMLAALA